MSQVDDGYSSLPFHGNAFGQEFDSPLRLQVLRTSWRPCHN